MLRGSKEERKGGRVRERDEGTRVKVKEEVKERG